MTQIVLNTNFLPQPQHLGPFFEPMVWKKGKTMVHVQPKWTYITIIIFYKWLKIIKNYQITILFFNGLGLNIFNNLYV